MPDKSPRPSLSTGDSSVETAGEEAHLSRDEPSSGASKREASSSEAGLKSSTAAVDVSSSATDQQRENDAATQIQSMFRGKAVRTKASSASKSSGKSKTQNSHLARQQKAREQEERLLRREKLQMGYKRKEIEKSLEDEKAIALQSGTRAYLHRKAMKEGEVILEKHLSAMTNAAKLASIAREARDESFAEFRNLEALIGKQEQADYLKEIEGKKILTSRRLQELEKGRFYLSAQDQRRVYREIAQLKEQLADLSHEAILIKNANKDPHGHHEDAHAMHQSEKLSLIHI